MNPNDSAKSVIFLSGDLIFSSRVQSACQASGLSFWLGTNLPAIDPTTVGVIILDLATRSGITTSLVQEARTRYPAARLIAYGPHVHKGRLDAARDAGFDQVLTRGQFDHFLPKLSQLLVPPNDSLPQK